MVVGRVRGVAGEVADRARSLASGVDGRPTNVALAVLVALAVVTGALNFALGTGWVAWPTVAHGVIGLAVVLLSGWKWRIARRGLRRRPATSTWPSLLLALLSVVALVSGVLHATGLVLRYGPLDDMQVHVGSALLALPVLGWHLVARRTVPGRQDLTRRNLLRAGLLLGAAGAAWATLEAVLDVRGLPGADRRATGSFEQASGDPARMPAIIWLFDPSLDLAAEDWRLRVVDGGGTRLLSLDDLGLLPATTETAIIDCTSGWWSSQAWSGVALADLVGELPDDARSVRVTSATGYTRRFPLRDLDRLLLATGYEGRPLAPRHGFPARLVAPGRRGFWWVKWVTSVELDDVPWWRQSPYPLT